MVENSNNLDGIPNSTIVSKTPAHKAKPAGKGSTQPKPTGRPSKFNDQMAVMICSQIAVGRSLRKICEADGMPTVKTVFNWLHSNDTFLQQYARAKEESADSFVDEMIDIADSADADNPAEVNKARLRVDTRKWVASKLKPKRYGDKLDLTTDGKELPAPIFGGVSATTNDKQTSDS